MQICRHTMQTYIRKKRPFLALFKNSSRPFPIWSRRCFMAQVKQREQKRIQDRVQAFEAHGIMYGPTWWHDTSTIRQHLTLALLCASPTDGLVFFLEQPTRTPQPAPSPCANNSSTTILAFFLGLANFHPESRRQLLRGYFFQIRCPIRRGLLNYLFQPFSLHRFFPCSLILVHDTRAQLGSWRPSAT